MQQKTVDVAMQSVVDAALVRLKKVDRVIWVDGETYFEGINPSDLYEEATLIISALKAIGLPYTSGMQDEMPRLLGADCVEDEEDELPEHTPDLEDDESETDELEVVKKEVDRTVSLKTFIKNFVTNEMDLSGEYFKTSAVYRNLKTNYDLEGLEVYPAIFEALNDLVDEKKITRFSKSRYSLIRSLQDKNGMVLSTPVRSGEKGTYAEFLTYMVEYADRHPRFSRMEVAEHINKHYYCWSNSRYPLAEQTVKGYMYTTVEKLLDLGILRRVGYHKGHGMFAPGPKWEDRASLIKSFYEPKGGL